MPIESTTKYWLALSRIRNLGAMKIKLLVESFGSVEAIFSASFLEISSLPKLSPELAQEIIKAGQNIAEYEKIAGHISNSGIDIICQDSLEYPCLLKKIKDSPPILYKKGDLQSLEMTVAIVGTRFPTKKGAMIAEEIAQRLAERNVIVVSGLAKGIDTSAHKGALSFGGKTIAVIGSGINKIYPDENFELAENICNNGLILSECLPDEVVSKGRLIQRNRLTSGISVAVILVEPERGSLNTANWALKQGRKAFVFDADQKFDNNVDGLLRIINMNWIDTLIEHLISFKKSLLLAN